MENQNDDKDFIAAPSPTENVVEKPPRARVSDAPLPEEEDSAAKSWSASAIISKGSCRKSPKASPAESPAASCTRR